MASVKAATKRGRERSPLMRCTTSNTTRGTTKIMSRLRWAMKLPEFIRRKAEQVPSDERRERVSRQVSGQEKSRPSAQRGCNE